MWTAAAFRFALLLRRLAPVASVGFHFALSTIGRNRRAHCLAFPGGRLIGAMHPAATSAIEGITQVTIEKSALKKNNYPEQCIPFEFADSRGERSANALLRRSALELDDAIRRYRRVKKRGEKKRRRRRANSTVECTFVRTLRRRMHRRRLQIVVLLQINPFDDGPCDPN